jgi:ubiquinone/menaquinone biosynthesis C-methylase UbiE
MACRGFAAFLHARTAERTQPHQGEIVSRSSEAANQSPNPDAAVEPASCVSGRVAERHRESPGQAFAGRLREGDENKPVPPRRWTSREGADIPAPATKQAGVLPVLSVFRVLQRLVRSYLGVGALDRLSRYIYDGAYGLPQWQEISTFNYGYAPSDGSVAELWPNEPHQIQLYAEVAKAVRAAGGRTTPSRLLEVCCGRGGGLAYLHATLSPEATIGIDRSLPAIRHGRNGNAAIAHLQGHALQLPLPEASIDLAINVEALADVAKLPFLAEICRVLTENGVFAVADTMPHRPEACCLGLIALGQKNGLRLVYFRDITVNVCEACRNDDQRRSQLVNRLPRYLRPIAREWVSLPGSTRFRQFERKERCYFIAVMVKDAGLSAAAG